MTLRILASLAALAVFASTAVAQTKPTLTFSAIPDQDETRLAERFNRFAKYLEDKLDVTVRYLPVKSYGATVTAFKNNQVQVAWFGGLSGVQARLAVAGSEAIAQGDVDPTFKSYFIANVATGLTQADQLSDAIKGKTFTFGSRDSTSGRLFPENFLRERFAMAPDKIFSRVGYSGDHSRTIQLVQSGAFEVGAVNYLVWDSELKAGKIDTSKVRVIWTTPPYPDYNWTVRGDIDATFGAGFKEKLKATILGIEDKTLLGYFDRGKFIAAKNSDYQAIEDIGKLTGLIN